MKSILIIFSFILSFSLFAQENKRFLQMQELVSCKEETTLEKPFEAHLSNGTIYHFTKAEVKFTNYTDSNFSTGGMFEFEGTDGINGRQYWGSLTNPCIQNGTNINCENGHQGTFEYREEKNEKFYLIKHYFSTSNTTIKMKFKPESCSFWPHGRPSLKERIILFSVPLALYCANNGLMIFRISKYSGEHPLRIDFGVEDEFCVYTQLSSPTNYEFWMNARNDMDSDIEINSSTFAQEQKFDIDSDGDLDLIKMEKSFTNPLYPKGVYDFVLYKTP